MMLQRTLRIALLLLCLTASTAQSWVAQVHAHHGHVEAAQILGHAVVAGATHAAHGAQAGGDAAELACLLCQVAAQASAALAGSPSQLVVLQPAFARLSAAPGSALQSSSPSHHWSSRGPPSA